MQAEVKRLVELRSQIAEYDDAYEKATAPLKLERDALQATITEELRRWGVLSQRFQEATVTRSVRKTVQIADQAAAIADLKAKGLGRVRFGKRQSIVLRQRCQGNCQNRQNRHCRRRRPGERIPLCAP
jgi:hypothetical protein